jgi:hypothetical protein
MYLADLPQLDEVSHCVVFALVLAELNAPQQAVSIRLATCSD